MATYTALRNTAKSFDGAWRKYPGGSRDAGGANLVIKSVPDNLKTLTVTITASPNQNGDGGLYKVSLRRNGVDLAQLNTSKLNTTQFSYTFQKADIFAGQEFDIRYWNNEGGWDSEDPADYYKQESEDSAILAAYTGNTKLGTGLCTISLSESATFEDGPPPPPTEGCCPVPPPWPTFTCPNPPSLISSSGGLLLRKTGDKQVALNLKNYANKLVTLRITHEVNGTWTQSFSFNIPNCSDISPDTGGQPYSKNAYSNPNISGTNTITLHNVDGGDYDYVFNCDSVTGPKPTRQNCREEFITTCTVNEEGEESCTTVCVPKFYTEEYPFAWPPCPQGVDIAQTGGSRVRWYYEDGGGATHGDQIVTIEVISTRDVVPSSGSICTSTLKNSVWNGEPTSASANCFANYVDYADKIRYRVPSSRASRTTFPSPACYSNFRNIAGAKPVNVSSGSGNQYSVLHVIEEKFRYDNTLQLNVPYLETTSLVYGTGVTIVVDPVGSEENLYPVPAPEFNSSTFNTSDPHYVISSDLLNNKEGSTISIGQKITAEGLSISGSIQQKKRVKDGNLEVWFYIDEQSSITRDDSALHNPTTLTSSGNITVEAKGTMANDGETINSLNTYHYEVTFKDLESATLASNAANIEQFIVSVVQEKNNLGSTIPVLLGTKTLVGNKLKVWFITPGGTGEPTYKNTYVRDWRITRQVTVNYKGYTFMRNWYINDGPGS